MNSIPKELEIFENQQEFEDKMVKNLALDNFMHKIVNLTGLLDLKKRKTAYPRSETIFSTSP